MSKFLIVPEDITLTLDADRVSDPPIIETRRFKFIRYFLAYLLDEPETFGKKREDIFMAAEIEAKFYTKNDDDERTPLSPLTIVKLSDSEASKLKKAAEARGYQQGITVWRGLIPFFKAVEDMTNKDPRGAAAPLPDGEEKKALSPKPEEAAAS